MILAEAEALPDSGRPGGSFRLVFVGPASPYLPQATYRFTHDAAIFDIFIVPIARTDAGYHYEAIFY